LGKKETGKKDNARQEGPAPLTRRTFLKVGALGAGSVVLPSVGTAAGRTAPSDPTREIDREVMSACQFCQVRCTTLVQVKNDRVVNVYGNPGNFWTGGSMCPKGQAMVELTYSPHRLHYPMKRDGEGWKRISYREAVDLTAARISAVKTEFPDDYSHRIALFAPLWESRESELAALMALNLAGFPDVCAPGDACIGSSATALRLCLGTPISTTTVDEMLNARLVVLLGANIAEIYPPYVRWVDMAREKGVQVVYVDPRRTPTSNHSDEQLMGRPGTDGALVLGLIRFLAEEGRYDKQFVKSHVNGFDEVVKAAEKYTLDEVSRITWIPREKVIGLARRLAESDRTIIWLGGSISRYTNSLQTVRAVVALQAMTGNLSGPGKGIMNVQGGKPGGEERVEEMGKAKDLDAPLSLRKVVFGMNQKRVKVLLLNSSYRRYPDANKVKEAIQKVDFVVYRGFFMDDEAKLSHLIIPGTMVFESSGSQYGAQRQVVWRNAVVPPPGETVEDWRFYMDLGKKVSGDAYPRVNSPEDMYELVRHVAPTWTGLTIDRIKADPTGISWPCPTNSHPGTRGSLYPDNRFQTDHGKVELKTPALGPIEWSEPEGSPFADGEEGKTFPLVFVQGKVVQHWQHTYTNWSRYMSQFSEGNYVQVNPATGKHLGLKEGDRAYLETEIGKISVTVRVNDLILPGVVWTPSHPAKASPYAGNTGVSINTIIPSHWDKVSAQFNGFGCRLTKA
jgi:formate dehydrogenase (coenzyme F420) alpha subunit